MFPEIARDDVFRIETRRLWLRWPRVADAAAIARQAGEKAVADMTASIPSPYSEQQAIVSVLAAREMNADGGGLYLSLTHKARPNEVIGAVSVMRGADNRAFLGYWVGMSHWGAGLATEAAQAMIDVAFGLTETVSLHASVVPVNTASRRVLKKCGFAHYGGGMNDAPARGGAQAVDFYRLGRSTFVSLKGWREPRFGRDDDARQAMQ